MRIVVLVTSVFLLNLSVVVPCEAEEAVNTEVFSDHRIASVSLPTDRLLQDQRNAASGAASTQSKSQLKVRKRRFGPQLNVVAEWQSASDDVGLSSVDVSINQAVYPFFGPPPPVIQAGYSFTEIDSRSELNLPDHLHEISLGTAWIRKIDHHWMARLAVSAAFASDFNNTSGDAWQARGAAFAMYMPNEDWTFAFGAVATGREDLPVIPAVGAIWQPTDKIKINLMMPRPRVSWLAKETLNHQHWLYAGGGISGGTWAIRPAAGQNDRMSYGEWRVVVGYELTPPQTRGSLRPTGSLLSAEVGYSLGRDVEFESARPDLSLRDTFFLRTVIGF